ncbi:protein lin-9 homolog isoform X1 [Pomacea canaliculata]|uniref:protein lin-9 homolog isoform X1 n=1 Tax=Pomacea canaliculata TaxID=400727 RepID=UPI000D737B00|nr:protein lin-9 homolog isoform X1 [Pomacea canaliculata]
MAEDSLESSAHALVSLREGSGIYRSPPRRGNPPRIRKKNQRFYNDDEETDYSPIRSPKKQPKLSLTHISSSLPRPSSVPSTPEKPNKGQAPVTSGRSILPIVPDKKTAQAIGVRLRNLLKLPKAHKWVCYEFFYSNLDAPLFLGQNDFCICLQESFPQLKTKKLTRVEWCKIRRLMGKPRRCSSAFFDEERRTLHERRDKIRLLQQRKLNEFNSLKDLPEEIPLHLVIGTKVTARLRKPQDGLFTGTIKALDTTDNTYRVTFDRQGLGTHSIPDFEVLSSEPGETIPLSAFQQKQRPRQALSLPRFMPGASSPGSQTDNDPVINFAPFKGRLLSLDGGTYGGFPIKYLVLVTRLSKILKVKKDWINQLKEMNTQAEKMFCLSFHQRSYQQPITRDFQRSYAEVILELEKLNKDLTEHLVDIQQYSQELAPEQGLPQVDQPSEVKKRCDSDAQTTVAQICQSMFSNRKTAKNDRILKLVTGLTSLMLQIRTFSESDFNSFEFRSLQDSLREIKETLDRNNINSFQNNVEIHINHIQSGLSQMGNLHAFASSMHDS